MKRIRVVIDETRQFVREYDVEDDCDVDDALLAELVDYDEDYKQGYVDTTERLLLCTGISRKDPSQ